MTPHSYYDIAIEGQPKEQIYYHRSIPCIEPMENYYISRDGIKDYQRNNRSLLGDGRVLLIKIYNQSSS